MTTFQISTANAGFGDVRVVIASKDPVEFVGAQYVIDHNTAIYADGAEVRFRLAGTEPSPWMTERVHRTSFDTAAHFMTGV